MKKIIYILSAIIIVLLIVTIIQGIRIKELSKTDSKEKDTSVVNEDSKKYAGIYHANYYSTSGKMMDENIRLNEDGSCKLLYSTNCTWKIKSEKVLNCVYCSNLAISCNNPIIIARFISSLFKFMLLAIFPAIFITLYVW